MRTITQLLQEHERVWFYLQDKETEQAFVNELNAIGATYLNGKQVTQENCSPIMAVHKDLKVAHLMIMIWNASFSPSFQEHSSKELSQAIKVDYAKYAANEDEYSCTKSSFIPL